MPSPATSFVLSHPARFCRDVLHGFMANQGLLLSGAVAYYSLLSIIPVLALMLLLLSNFVEPRLLLDTLTGFLSMSTVVSSEGMLLHMQSFLRNWQVIGIIGLLLIE